MPPEIELSDDERSEIANRVREMSPSQVNDRLLELASYGRPTARQRAEHRILSERQLRNFAAATALGIDPAELDNPNPARLPGEQVGRSGIFASANRPQPGQPGPRGTGPRDTAMRSIEQHSRRGVLDAAAADRLDGLLRTQDRHGQFAGYVAAVADDHYQSAFAKLLRDPVQGHLRFSQAEVEAVRQASDAAAIRDAALETGTPGFPLPLTVDPSIVLTGSGALNPLRQLADVRTITTHDHVGVSSSGVVAAYVPEGSEAEDASPSLAGPRISTHQGRAFVQFSIEAGQDDPGLANELGKLIADARDVLDAEMFVTGTGADQPYGLLGGDATYSLGAAQQVSTAGTAAVAIGDYWALKAAIPPRFIATTTFVAAPATFDAAYRLVGGGSQEPPLFADQNRQGPLMGRPLAELSTLGTGATTGTKLMIGGDFRVGYRIVDRIGLSVELIPHMMGTARQMPLGVRGLYCYWRTGAAVVGANALRVLVVK